MHQENHQVLHYATLSLVFFTLLSGFVLSQHTFVSATDPSATATATVHVAEACTLSANNTSSHNAEMSNGTYEEGIGSTTFNVKCNDASGFALYAIGYSNEEYGNTNMIGDSTSLTIPTGTEAALGSASSHWSMKVTKDTTSYTPANLTINNSFDSYHVIPDTYTKVATYATGTDGVNGTGSSVIATYDARVSATQAADSYIGKVKYTLVHPNMVNDENRPVGPLPASDCPAGYVCYAPNSGDVEGSMATLGAIASSDKAGKVNLGTSATTANLIAPNYKRSGYGFAGWSTDFEVTNSSTIYGPNETITVNLSSSGLILYPVWIAKETGVTMQTFNSSTYTNYTSAPNGTVIALEDERDHDVYAVAKLADGKWWMIENLRLDESATLTTTNTHNPLHDANNNVILKIDYTAGTTATHLAASNSGTWCTNYNATCTDQTMLNTNNTRLSDSSLNPSYSANNATSKWYSYGNYYNWYSATAGNGTYSFTIDNNPVTGDLCPAGWRLPKGGQTTVNTTADYYVLIKTLMSGTEPNYNNTNGYGGYYGTVDGVDLGATASNSLRAYPNNFVYSGNWRGAQVGFRSSRGYYWSSSNDVAYTAYSLILRSSTVGPGNNGSTMYDGYSVRCVADTTP